MGSGVSHHLQNDAKALEASRNAVTDLFVRESVRLNSCPDLTEEQVFQEFKSVLAQNEQEILAQMARAHHEDRPACSLDTDFDTMKKNITHGHEIAKKKEALNFLCCVDGSAAADAAFRTVLHLRRKHDHICMFYAYDEDYDALNKHKKFYPEIMRQRYEGQLVQLNSETNEKCYSFHFVPRGDREVVDIMREYLHTYRPTEEDLAANNGEYDKLEQFQDTIVLRDRPDFIVLGRTGGSHGHQEHKADTDTSAPYQETAMGSTTDLALRTITSPCIIVRVANLSNQRTFVMSVDDSVYSKQGLQVLYRLMTPRDTLKVLHISFRDEDDGHIKEIENYYTSELATHGPVNSQFITLSLRGNMLVNAICDYAHSINCDFLALAPRAIGNKRVSSITEDIISSAKCNIVLCKN